MSDLLFDIETRELVITGGDLTETDNPSTQNGGIILNSRCAIFQYPALGIGLEQIISSQGSVTAYELNRWANQVKSDGGKGSYEVMLDETGTQPTLTTKVDYL